jgi:hypothetical protein
MREHASDLSSWKVFADGVSDQLNQLAIDGTLIVNLLYCWFRFWVRPG